MKRVIALILFLVTTENNLIAQKKPGSDITKKYVFNSVKIGVDGGFPANIGNSIQFNFNKKYILGAGMQMIGDNYHDLPPDYDGSCFSGDCTPAKQFYIVSIFAGKSFLEKNKFKSNFKGGISWVYRAKPVFTKDEPGNGFNFGPNYNSFYQIKRTIGVMAVAEEEWNVSKCIGLHLSLGAKLNPIQSIIFINTGIDFYLFRRNF